MLYTFVSILQGDFYTNKSITKPNSLVICTGTRMQAYVTSGAPREEHWCNQSRDQPIISRSTTASLAIVTLTSAQTSLFVLGLDLLRRHTVAVPAVWCRRFSCRPDACDSSVTSPVASTRPASYCITSPDQLRSVSIANSELWIVSMNYIPWSRDLDIGTDFERSFICLFDNMNLIFL